MQILPCQTKANKQIRENTISLSPENKLIVDCLFGICLVGVVLLYFVDLVFVFACFRSHSEKQLQTPGPLRIWLLSKIGRAEKGSPPKKEVPKKKAEKKGTKGKVPKKNQSLPKKNGDPPSHRKDPRPGPGVGR